ncbi:MAG: hypothetical protein ACFFER_13915 [Candidatus Thorarchaeota archaeon]
MEKHEIRLIAILLFVVLVCLVLLEWVGYLIMPTNTIEQAISKVNSLAAISILEGVILISLLGVLVYNMAKD